MKNQFCVSALVIWATALRAADVPPAATNTLVLPTNMVRVTSSFVSALAEQMRTNHPALHALQWRANAATQNVRSIRTWEDPMAMVGGMAAEREMRAEDGDVVYGLQQKLPLFGKPQAARRVAQAEAEVELGKKEVQFQTMRRDLAKTLFRAALSEQALVLGQRDIAWLDTLVNTVEANYRNGAATLFEVIQAQNERARRINELRVDESRLLHERIALYRFVGSESFELPRLELPPIASPVAFTPRLMQLAYGGEPKLRLMRSELKQSQEAVGAARRQRLPDFTIGTEGRHYVRASDFRSAEVLLSFNLPWGNRSKYDAEIKREHAKAVAVEYDIENEQNALAEEIHQLTIMIGNARREALLYRDEVIPRSRQAFDVAYSAWLSGRGMLRDVIEARRMLTEAELMQARAVSEQYQAMSELVLCCGLGDLEALEMIGIREAEEPRKDP